MNNDTRFFHPGEAAVQQESGSDPDLYDQWAAESMGPDLSQNEAQFVQARTFSMAASVDASDRPWASPLLACGPALFTLQGPTELTIAAQPDNGDPLLTNIADNGRLGVLFFDPSRRRRAKSMGTAEGLGNATIRYSLTRNFGLCPKYIHKREHHPGSTQPESVMSCSSTRLDEQDMAQLSRSDTAFLASFYPAHGPDVTHRGGEPGFVRVVGETTIEMPEYVGNGMFNTLGNLRADARLALTDIDFSTGRTVHTTGVATVSDEVDLVRHRGATRLITLDIDEVLVTQACIGTWTDVEASRYNPELVP